MKELSIFRYSAVFLYLGQDTGNAFIFKLKEPAFGINAYVPGGSLKMGEFISNSKGAWCIYFYFIPYRNTCISKFRSYLAFLGV